MKKIIYILLIISAFTSIVKAQDCSSPSDCLQQAQAIKRYDKSILPLLDNGIKMAKKDKAILAQLLTLRGMYLSGYGNKSSKDAEKDLKAAIKADGKYYPAHSYLLRLDRKFNLKYEKILKINNEKIAQFPNEALAYYDRAETNAYHNRKSLAFADYEKAYIKLITEPENATQLSWKDKSDICMDYCMAYMKSNNIYVYDEKAMKILESGDKIGSQDPLLLGRLSMAYYDNGDETKAREIGMKNLKYDTDKYYSKNIGLNFMNGYEAYNQDNTKGATNLWSASKHNGRWHPLINFYSAMALWGHNAAAFDAGNTNLWGNQLGIMIQWLENTVKTAPGTKYANLEEYARKNLEILNDN